MPPISSARHGVIVTAVLASVVVGSVAIAGDDPPIFNAFISPTYEYYNYDPGGVDPLRFELGLSVDSTAVQFNAYETVIEFDHEFVVLDSVTEGELMTASGCSRWFPPPVPGDSTVSISHSLLCAGGELNGPGELAVLHFTAVDTGLCRVRWVTVPDRTFLDAGLWVSPGHPTFPRQVALYDALIELGPILPVPPLISSDGALRVEVGPNPVRASRPVQIDATGPANDGVEVTVFDVTGRRLWHRSTRFPGSGRLQLFWWGDDAGVPVTSGVYFFRVQSARTAVSGRVTRLD